MTVIRIESVVRIAPSSFYGFLFSILEVEPKRRKWTFAEPKPLMVSESDGNTQVKRKEAMLSLFGSHK